MTKSPHPRCLAWARRTSRLQSGSPNLLRLVIIVAAVLAGGFGALQVGASQPPNPTPHPPQKPDLMVSRVDFRTVKHLKTPAGEPCELFNLQPVIANRGEGAAGGFRILLERQKGPAGTWSQACPLCYWKVAGLKPGAIVQLDVRQFSTCEDPSPSFRVTADIDSQVAESDEGNNRKVASYHGGASRKGQAVGK